MVVTRPFSGSGLGANLLSIVGALYFAERTRRDLIVDWTGMDALRDKRANYFTTFFEPIRHWRGVRVHYTNEDGDVTAGRYDVESAHELDRTTIPAALAGTLDAPCFYLHSYHYYRVFNACPEMSPAARFEYTTAFYRALRPRGETAARLAVEREKFANRIVIGLNVRTGNGHPTYVKGGLYAERSGQHQFTRGDFARRVATACHDCLAGVPREVWDGAAFFVVTDAHEMQQRLLRLPRAFAARTIFPPSGTGHSPTPEQITDTYPDVEIVRQTIVDMFLLAECAGLVYNYSDYIQYARHVTKFHGGNERQLEHYFENRGRAVGRRVVRWLRHRRARPVV